MNTDTLIRDALIAVSLIGIVAACSWQCWLIALGFLTCIIRLIVGG